MGIQKYICVSRVPSVVCVTCYYWVCVRIWDRNLGNYIVSVMSCCLLCTVSIICVAYRLNIILCECRSLAFSDKVYIWSQSRPVMFAGYSSVLDCEFDLG